MHKLYTIWNIELRDLMELFLRLDWLQKAFRIEFWPHMFHVESKKEVIE